MCSPTLGFKKWVSSNFAILAVLIRQIGGMLSPAVTVTEAVGTSNTVSLLILKSSFLKKQILVVKILCFLVSV